MWSFPPKLVRSSVARRWRMESYGQKPQMEIQWSIEHAHMAGLDINHVLVKMLPGRKCFLSVPMRSWTELQMMLMWADFFFSKLKLADNLMNDIELFCCVQTLGVQIQVKTFRIDCTSVLLIFLSLRGSWETLEPIPAAQHWYNYSRKSVFYSSCIPKSCSNKKICRCSYYYEGFCDLVNLTNCLTHVFFRTFWWDLELPRRWPWTYSKEFGTVLQSTILIPVRQWLT